MRNEEISKTDYQSWFILHDDMYQRKRDVSVQVQEGSSSKHVWQSKLILYVHHTHLFT